MAGISRLLEIFRQENKDPGQLFQSLRSDAAGQGLRSFLSILRHGIGSDGEGKLGFEGWSRPQIEATVSVAKLIIAASVAAPVEHAEAVVLAIIENSLELCTCLLERSKFEGDDTSFQNGNTEVLEIALVGGKDFEACKLFVNTVEESLPTTADLGFVELNNYAKCNIQGVDCLKKTKPVDRVLMALASECLQPDYPARGFTQHSLPKSLNSIMSLSQHWAVVHVKCLPRLLILAKELLIPPSSSRELTEDVTFCLRLSFSLRILKLLVSLTKDVPVVDFDVDLLRIVSCLADSLPVLFKLEAELECESSTVQNSLGSLLLSLLEEFLQFVHIVFCDGVIFQNVRTAIIASALDALGSSLWRSNRSSSSLKVPVVYCPQIVMHLLKLIQDVKKETSQILNWKEKFDMDPPDSLSNSESRVISCHAHSEDVYLLRYYTCQEHLRIIFPLSRQWVDDLVHLVLFLHSEGVRSRLKVERLRPTCTKPVVSDLDSVTSHEEEAIFGDLFSEASRPTGSSDGHDQPPVTASGFSSGQNMPIIAAAELLNFLKLCIFSPDWHHTVYDDACKKVNEHHIDCLLSIILCQSCVDDKPLQINCALSSQRTFGHVNEICFELLHNLLVRHALSSSLEEHLVDEILMVNNGKFAYNDHTLTLLAHALISKAGMTESHLASKIYRSYVNFIIERTKDILNECPDLSDFLGTLPCIFHIEILLMAFHLANEVEKAALARSISLALREINGLPDRFCTKQLSCWALLVSRLVLVLRHMVLHPSTSPSWLLVKLRSKLREASSRVCFSHDCNDNTWSWVSIAAVNILGDCVNELPVVNGLLPHLIDVATLPALFCGDYDGFQQLGLNHYDLFATFSWILGFWNGKKAEALEDLLLERYIFMLCWDTGICVGSFCSPLKLQSEQEIHVSIADSFLNFGYFLLNQSSIQSEGADLSEALTNVLHLLHSTQGQVNTAELGWDFSRNGSWLALALSILHAGIWMLSVRNAVSGVDSLWIDDNAKDCKFFNSAEATVLSVIKACGSGWLLNFLSSCLKKQLQVLQEAFLSVIDDKGCFADEFSCLLLLKHLLLDRCRQNELLEKCGSDISQLDSIFCLLSKLDEAAIKENTGIRTRVLCRCLLHGFPSHSKVSSGLLLSCILTVRDIIYTLDELLKITCAGGNAHADAGVVHEILDSITSIKSDMIFQSVHGKCESIYVSLKPSLKGNLDYSYLFELKHILDLLAKINSTDVIDGATRETLIITALDKVDGLRRDPSKAEVFKFLLGTGQNACEEMKEYFGGQCVNLLVFVHSLDKCCSETVNLKVFNFFIDLLNCAGHPGLTEGLQKKFLQIDLLSLSLWLEKRLLGCTVESAGAVISKESSTALREATMNFVTCLICQPCEMISKDLRNQFVEAMLMSLDNAFTLYDISTAKAFFSFLVQLLSGESSMRQFLERIMLLIEKLTDREDLLQGLKFLFGFLGTVLGGYGANKNASDKVSGKLSSSGSFGAESLVSRQISRKNLESLILPHNQRTDSANVDCDATSADEDDDDDGTSDGELASVDKEEEDDSNSERALASQVCTFTSSGSNFMEQHWYFCYTCDLTVSKGCCSVCAKVCHRGHRVVYSRSSRFFCDCGAGGVRGSSCQCLKTRKFTSSSNSAVRHNTSFRSLLPFSEDGDQTPDSDSDLDDDAHADTDSFKLFIPKEVQDVLPTLLEEIDTERHVLGLCSKLLPAVISRRHSHLSKDKKVALGDIKVLSYNTDIFQLRKAFKSGSFDLKVKAEYTNSRDLKSHLISGSLVKSLFSSSARGKLAVGEGDKVAIFDASQLVGQPTVAPVTADKTSVKPLSRNLVRFEIVHLVFNPIVESYLAVAGYEECQVLTVNPRGEVTDRLAIELALQGAYIRRVDWVPGSQVHLLVVTNMFVKIYDLSQDNISPIHYFTLTDDLIVDATLVATSMGRVCLLVLSELGLLYRLELSMEGDAGVKPLKDIVQVQERDVQPKGLSLYFSPVLRLLFLSYQDGITLIGRLDVDAMSLTEVSAVYEDEQDGKIRPAGLHHWRELLVDSGVFICFSSLKANAALAVSLGPHELVAQNMRYTSGSALPLVGITAYKPLSKDKSHCLALQDDGSLQIYSHIPVGTDPTANLNLDKAKKLGAGILNSKGHAGMNTDFPLDFFEKTICITSEVKLSGDAIKNNDSEGAKQRLQSDDGFLESPSSSGFKITVSNPNPDIVMVGIRIQVGNTSVGHIPSDVTIFQRIIKFDEGMRSWYDIPFTTAESLLADEEFTISIGPTFDGSTLPRIDSLEIYGRAKDEFGWKEKMDAVLNMEAHVLGSSYGSAGVRKKCQMMQAASVHEQVLSDALKLLSRLYLSCRSWTCSEIEEAHAYLNKLRSKELLEAIFQSDRELLLQSSACWVLKAIFPKKEIYYHVKDTLRLLGVISALPKLRSRIGIGSAASGWVIKEFMAQLRAVSRIALHRRSNMVSFLETHGSGVVDGLMEVLWGILDLERPDTQTINSIVIPSVELIYSYAECLASQGCVTSGCSVAAAVILIKKLLFAPYEAVQTASSLALSSRLLQVPFPKQTMLAADDVAENPGMANMPSDMAAGTGGNSHIMIEEDSNTSSVQYCCDGCSTVPILRRRWHCNVCPDFDLCETCYEVMDADQLPPPHSKDHPMSAIPIEIDSVGGEGRGIHFTMDELSDASLMQVAGDINMQNSPSSIHILDSNESGELSTSMNQRIVSISASKRAVNSLLLQQLIVELKGWMETTYGFQGIPVMQLFYRLFSAVSASFMDSSKPENLDLEKIVKWFLDEINVNKPFAAKTRTGFGEVVILVFMFFTLMLRNWHQPGSESSQLKSAPVIETPDKGSCHIPLSSSIVSSSNDDQEKNEFASQLAHACSSLRQQAFVNYLMDILQQLVQQFKSSHVDVESSRGLSPGSGCGSLLTIRKELPAGNFSPFFSDSYAKAHRTDLFMDYHRLLLENTFRLVYSLVRPEKHDKCLVKEKTYRSSAGKELKLDGCQDVLCSYICNPHTSFVRRYARRLLLHVCGSKTQYYNVRDSWQFSNEVRKLYKLVNKSGGFQIPVPYERSVKLIKCLSAMSEVAGARPRNWQKYCIKHGDVLSFLMDGIFNFSEESVIQTLKLLSLAFYTGKDITPSILKAESGDGVGSNKAGSQSDSKKKRKVEDGNETGSEKPCLDMEQAVGIFCVKEGSVLRHFIDFFLLEWNSTSLRAEAKCVLYGVWHHGKKSFKETLLTALLQKVKILPMYGQNIVEYTELLTSLLGKVPDVNGKQHETELVNQCLMPDVVNNIFDTLHSRNELLANHPNSRIYSTLSGLVEFDGYYLESEPCVACSCPEVPYSRMKLESLKSETKFTDNRIIVKCTGSYTIQTVTMNVHDARKSRSVKVLNLYYNNTPVADLSELKNNWSLWKRAKSCHLAFNQTELKVEFPIPITACNFMIELDSFYESLQASSLESLQCPRCSRSVTDKHGICSNCHENAYQCRQCRNINYENLDSFLCNECGYSKYGRFEFNFMAKPSFAFDNIENDEDMKKVLAAIESESENAHRRYQQLLGFKKPLLKLVSSIGEHEIDSQQKDTVQQMMVSLPGPSCKINRKIALLGVLYGEKCKGAFDSVSKSVQTLQGLRRVLMTYLSQKSSDKIVPSSRLTVSRSPNNCYGCAATFVTQCMELLQLLSKNANCRKQLVALGILSELFENNIHQGPKTARTQARAVLCAFSEGDANAVAELNILIQKKVMYCLEHHRSMDIAQATREELILLSETCALVDEFWEARLRVAFKLLFSSIKLGAKHPAISEHVILPCLRIISQACTPPKTDNLEKEQETGKSTSNLQPKNDQSNSSASLSKMTSDLPEKNWDGHKGQNIPLLSYSEWERGASYLDFVRRQYRISQAVKASKRSRQEPHRRDYLALKYALRWKCIACRRMGKTDFSAFELGSWISVLILSACSQSIRLEVCTLITLLCPQNSSRQFQLLNLLMMLLPASLSVGDSAAEYFELFFKMIGSEAARLFLTAKGCLTTICRLISQEVANVESQERSLNIDISQGFILHKLVELLSKFLEVPNIRIRFMHDELISEILEALLVIRGLIVQKTKLISDCNRLLKDLLDSLLLESSENKRHFIRACISGLQSHAKEQKGRTSLFILEQLCNVICPSKPEPVYLLNLNKAHTQEEFIRGSMTKNPYSSAEIGSLMRDVKNKICHQLDLLGLLEDDYGMELLVAGNIISLDLSISQVYEQVWKKSYTQSQNAVSNSALLSSVGFTSSSEFPPMTVTYRLQGLDGEATEPMIKELEEDREESQDPEVEFAIAGAVRECGGLEIILCMLQCLRDDQLKSNQEELGSVLNLLMYCCKIRENRRALLQLGALGLLLETARRAFSVDAMEPAEGILLIVESLTMEANESDIGITQSVLTVSNEETGAGDQAKKIVLMFLERLCHPSGMKKSNKQQRNNEMVARILPYLTYGEPAAMEALIQHFDPYLRDWGEFDCLQKSHQENPKYENLAQQAAKQRSAVENFVRVSESLKTSSCGGRLKDIILEKGITEVAVRHLRESFAVTGQAGFKSSAEWVHGLKLPSIPLILSMLRGISRGHLATQMCIDEGGILPLLHALEGVAGENEIGARAENLLDTLSDKERTGDGFLGEKVHKLRHATRDEMRRRALRKREELLQGLGMRQELASDGGERIVVSQPIIEGLDDVEEEEDGLACMVCREGYTLRPNDVLGVYSYTKRVNLGGGSTGNARGDCVYTTVSHFNIIHFQCHQEAKRADAALKNPKKEWEGATLRNNETLCNSIFPLRGPSVPLAQYVRYVDQFWENLNALGRADGSRLRLLTYDIVLMLARFATGASFSTDSRGGGRESNSRFLPFMVQMASHLLDQGGSNQPRRAMAKSVSAYLAASSSTLDSSTRPSVPPSGQRPSTGAADETVQFMMVNSLLSESYEDWALHRLAFLQWGIYHAYMQHTHGRSTLRLSSDPGAGVVKSDAAGPSSDPSNRSKLFPIIQPMLVYMGIIEQLQRFFKLDKTAAGTGTVKQLQGEDGSGGGGGGLDGWEFAMKERLVNMKEMVSFSKEMLSWLEDMTSAGDVQEAFDVMGVLGDVLSGGYSHCEDFVQAAIAAGKS